MNGDMLVEMSYFSDVRFREVLCLGDEWNKNEGGKEKIVVNGDRKMKMKWQWMEIKLII